MAPRRPLPMGRASSHRAAGRVYQSRSRPLDARSRVMAALGSRDVVADAARNSRRVSFDILQPLSAAEKLHHARAKLAVVIRLKRSEHTALAFGKVCKWMAAAAEDIVIEESLPCLTLGQGAFGDRDHAEKQADGWRIWRSEGVP